MKISQSRRSIEAKRARLRQFLEAAEYIQYGTEGLSSGEIAAQLEKLRQAAYEAYYEQVEVEEPAVEV